jgi:hypothetical protein
MPTAGCRGGINWKRVWASLSITGAIWQMKGKPDVLEDVSIEAEVHNDVSAHTYVNYKCGNLSGPKIRAALPAELVHRPGTMAYSGSIRRNK